RGLMHHREYDSSMTWTDAHRWQLAGLTDEDGNLDRAVAGARWGMPTVVELDGERLVWRWQGSRFIEPGPTMFSEFLRLAEGSDERILQYARQWGVQLICRHGSPGGHPAGW